MGKATGFIEFGRTKPPSRPVTERIGDYRHVYKAYPIEDLTRQAARCMDCGIPFCHQGCPLGNLIPEWNDLIWQGQLASEAMERLHADQQLPRVHRPKLCPAPCEASCVLGINGDPRSPSSRSRPRSSIKAFEMGWIVPLPPATNETWQDRSRRSESGPAGLAVAQQLTRAGHSVTVSTRRDDRPGGLLRYGIPDFKMEKRARRPPARPDAKAEGVPLRTGVNVGVGRRDVPADLRCADTTPSCSPSAPTKPRDLDRPRPPARGRRHFAMPVPDATESPLPGRPC